jgi:hypothetical protein
MIKRRIMTSMFFIGLAGFVVVIPFVADKITDIIMTFIF